MNRTIEQFFFLFALQKIFSNKIQSFSKKICAEAGQLVTFSAYGQQTVRFRFKNKIDEHGNACDRHLLTSLTLPLEDHIILSISDQNAKSFRKTNYVGYEKASLLGVIDSKQGMKNCFICEHEPKHRTVFS